MKNVKPKMAASPGFLSASLGRRDLGRVVEFILVTEWRDMEAVKAFSGSAPEKAVIPEGTSEVLSDYDSFVRLYEIIDHC